MVDCTAGMFHLTGKIVNRRIADGTRNLAKEPAMTEDEALRALMTGKKKKKKCTTSGLP